jgi:acyl-CoA hydrolase
MTPAEIETLAPGTVTEARLIEMVFPEQTNHYGTLFGGQALALMDKAAFIVASRYARRTVVTASSEKCDFHVPIRQGQLVELVTRVIATGRTSITVEIDMYSEDLLSGDRQLGTRGRFVMVALDAHGKPAVVPQLAKPVGQRRSREPVARRAES